MPIAASSPTVVEAKTSFDSWWIKSINVQAPSPTSKVNANVVAQKYSSSTGQLSAQPSDNCSILIQDVLGAASTTYPLIGPAFASIIAAVTQVMTGLKKL